MAEEVKKKIRRRRKPLTEEQKAERRERLKKAREAKAPPKYVTVAPSVRALPDDHYLSLAKVRGWLKKNKQEREQHKNNNLEDVGILFPFAELAPSVCSSTRVA